MNLNYEIVIILILFNTFFFSTVTKFNYFDLSQLIFDEIHKNKNQITANIFIDPNGILDNFDTNSIKIIQQDLFSKNSIITIIFLLKDIEYPKGGGMNELMDLMLLELEKKVKFLNYPFLFVIIVDYMNQIYIRPMGLATNILDKQKENKIISNGKNNLRRKYYFKTIYEILKDISNDYKNWHNFINANYL